MIHRLKGYLKKMGPAWIIRTTEEHLGKTWAYILTIDALIATWLAAMVLMNTHKWSLSFE